MKIPGRVALQLQTRPTNDTGIKDEPFLWANLNRKIRNFIGDVDKWWNNSGGGQWLDGVCRLPHTVYLSESFIVLSWDQTRRRVRRPIGSVERVFELSSYRLL